MGRQGWTPLTLCAIVLAVTSCTYPEADEPTVRGMTYLGGGPLPDLRVALVEPEDAAEQGIYPEVFVDGKPVGNFSPRGYFDAHLPAGPHLIEVREPGFQDWSREIHLTAPGDYFLAVQLEPAREQMEPEPEAKEPPPAEVTP
ncbi:MAG: PEGA domain-containing protein [Candidatus Brocadiia bacterium]